MPTILIVDDEPDIVEFQAAFLKRRKYNVLTATNTAEAMEAIKNNAPDVVFCDIGLETDDAGFCILEETKKLKPELPFYLITGYLNSHTEKQGLSLGAREVIVKPVSHDALEEKIKAVLP